jgi:hypothetical protein
MSFSYNPYNHIELVRARPDEVDKTRVMAKVLLDWSQTATHSIPVTAMDEARRLIAAGVTLPPELEPKNDQWTWYCHGCGGTGKEATRVLDDIIAEYRDHLQTSHVRSEQSFEGWSDF